MAVLLAIGLLAGVVTAISPCVLPVLPVLLAGGATGRKPVRIVAGLVASFSVFTLFAAWLLDRLGLPQDLLRNLAIAALAVLAATLLVPRVALLAERPLAVFSRFRPTRAGGGFLFGAALGLVFVPCAGPVLATVTVVAANNDVGLRAILLTVAYSVGAAIPMLLVVRGGRRASALLRRHAETVRVVSGTLVGLVALGLVLHLDDRLAGVTPAYTTFLQNRIEDNGAAKRELAKIRGAAAARGRRVDRHEAARAPRVARQGRARRLLDVLVHQLPAHAAAPEGVVGRIPRPGSRDRGRAHAGVRVRARRVERPRGGASPRHPLPGGAGQPLPHVGRLREPVLARRIPDRPAGPRSPHALRGGRLRRDGGPDPPPAGRRRQTRPARRGRDALGPPDAGELPRVLEADKRRRQGPGAGPARRLRVPRDAACEHARLRRALARRRRGGHRRPRRTAPPALRGARRLHRPRRPRPSAGARRREAAPHDRGRRRAALHGPFGRL